MKATQLFFDLGQSLFPDEARALSATVLDSFQPALVDTLMNYQRRPDGSRMTISRFPSVHFARFEKGFSLVGFGELGSSVALDIAAPLANGLSKKLDVAVRIESKEVQQGVEYRPYAMRYRVARMVVQKEREHLALMADPEKGAHHLEQLFFRSLRRQARFLDIELPQRVDVKFIGCTGDFAAKNKGLHLLGLKNATFEANVALSGLWSFGYMLSKGYGLVNADMQRGIGAAPQEVVR